MKLLLIWLGSKVSIELLFVILNIAQILLIQLLHLNWLSVVLNLNVGLNLLVPVLNEVLNHIKCRITLLKLVCYLRMYFPYRFQLVFSLVVVPVLKEYISWQLLFFKFLNMDKVAEVSPITPLGSMEIFTRDGFFIINLNKLHLLGLLLSIILLLKLVSVLLLVDLLV